MREGTPDVALDWSGSGQWGFSLGAQKGWALRQKPIPLFQILYSWWLVV